MVVKRTMYQRKVDVDMLNAIKSVLADVSSVSASSGHSIALWTVMRTSVNLTQYIFLMFCRISQAG